MPDHRRLYFVTHPDVVVDPQVPVPRWPLSERGRQRMALLLRQPWVTSLRAVYCSTEQKAIDGAAILAAHLGLLYTCREALGENDRSSTGFLPEAEFQATADRFFAEPGASVRGWETARAAQARIAGAVRAIVAADTTAGDIAVVSHGGVGALLLCHLSGRPISRAADQPGRSGGNYFRVDLDPMRFGHGWMPIDG